jgi:Mg-chelatase subunit ChlD
MRTLLAPGGAAIALTILSSFNSCDTSTLDDAQARPIAPGGSAGHSGTADPYIPDPPPLDIDAGLADAAPADDAGTEAGSVPDACATHTEEAQLSEVNLVFMLDDSGSMGLLDRPEHDPTRRWIPVTTALKAFFADPDSSGMNASLTFFPVDRQSHPADAPPNACDPLTYETPVVSRRPLPDPTSFAQAIAAITPDESGTPMRPALEGALAQARAAAAASDGAQSVVVLVTDGVPTRDCAQNGVADVERAASSAAPDIPTYVIGVGVLADLHRIARAGGTEQAFIVEIDDPARTQADFTSALNRIRESTLSCDLTLPTPPAGETLDPNKVNVEYTSGDGPAELLVSGRTCEDGEDWRYDDPAHPRRIELCPATCSKARADIRARLDIVLGCKTRLVIPR